MIVAVRGVIKLYQNIECAENLHQKILVFLISYNHWNMRIYTHYSEIESLNTKYYCYLLKSFDITSENDKDRWAAYQFTSNVYDFFISMHLDWIKSVVDQLLDSVLELFQFMLSTENALSSQKMMITSVFLSQEVDSFKKPTAQKAEEITTELWVMIQRLESKNEQQCKNVKQ